MTSKCIEKIKSLHSNVENIRNICILAHVDHGKTTLADSLIATCGIISNRLAGKMRYLDSRQDEKIRGITMKSSAITLHFEKDKSEYLINLIDSPGHVDFSGEVSTAVRLCDGAIIVVDAVEGVCSQTRAVLKQAWSEKLKAVLVLNKIDRLITELKMTPLEAFVQLQNILQQVNAVMGTLFSGDILEKDANTSATNHKIDQENQIVYDWGNSLEDSDDSNIYFSPVQGNVIFASAIDGWGFRVEQFANIYSSKLGIDEKKLCKTLWGDYYVNTKTKRVMKGAQEKGKKPLFVQFILENMWSVYDAVIFRKDFDRAEMIRKSLNLSISPRDIRAAKSEPKTYLKAICSQWLPISKAVLDGVVHHLPNPRQLAEERIEKLMCGSTKTFESLPSQSQDLKKNFIKCDSHSATTIAFVSKMIVVDYESLPKAKPKLLTKEILEERKERARQKYADMMKKRAIEQGDQIEVKSEQKPEIKEEEKVGTILAFARIFSGTLKVGQNLFVLGPKFDPSTIDYTKSEEEIVANNEHISRGCVEEVYNWLGKHVEICEDATSGMIVGISGFDKVILNSATISSSIYCPPFNPLYIDTSPILRVAVEPKAMSEMEKMIVGLKKLNQADPCVRVMIEDTGEHVIMAAGEVHLQRCLDDLKERFCQIELKVSKPKVPFRETIIPRPKLDMMNELIAGQEKNLLQKWKEDKSKKEKISKNQGAEVDYDEDKKKKLSDVIRVETANGRSCLYIKAVPLPETVAKLLEDNYKIISILNQLENKTKDILFQKRKSEQDQPTKMKEVYDQLKINEETLLKIKQFSKSLLEAFGSKRKWSNVINQIWSFGPRGNGPNLLVNQIPDYQRPSLLSCLEPDDVITGSYRENDQSIITGFQLATLSGPLCEEPLYSVCYVIEQWTMNDDVTDTVDNYGPLSGQLISTSKEGFRQSFQLQPQRLMVAMYTCTIQTSGDVLGKVYGVVRKRSGQIVSEDMKDGTNFFTIVTLIPIVESFGFVDEIRTKTSGMASPQLTFSHWQTVASDPFWVPTTEEELSHYGEKADFDNLAAKYMKLVRRRKGLYVEKTVEHAEKQRTITKNK